MYPKSGLRASAVLWRIGLKASWTRHFFILCQIFCHIWWFFRVERAESAAELWKINKYGNKFGKKMKKCLVQFVFNPFFGWFWVPENRISGNHSAIIYYIYFKKYKYHTINVFFCIKRLKMILRQLQISSFGGKMNALNEVNRVIASVSYYPNQGQPQPQVRTFDFTSFLIF